MRTFVLLICVILLSAYLPAAAGAAPDVFDPIVLRVDTATYTRDKNGLAAAGLATLAIPGAPALPVWTTAVELPADADWSVSYELGEAGMVGWQGAFPAVPVAEWPGTNGESLWAQPEQLPVPTLVDRPDPAIYSANAFYPAQVVQVAPEQWQRGRRFVRVQVFPFQLNPQRGQVMHHPAVRVTITLTPRADSAMPAAAPVRSPAAVAGTLRIHTGERGLYRLTYNDLQAAGVPVATVNPATFALTLRDQPIAIQVTGAADGRFDPADQVVFYAVPNERRYLANNLYQFTYGGAAGLRMTTRQTTPTASDPLISAMQHSARRENNANYYSTFEMAADGDYWFDTSLSVSALFPTVTRSYALNTAAPLVPLGDTATVRMQMQGGRNQDANPDHSVLARINNHELGLYQWEGNATPFTITETIPTAWLTSSNNSFALTASLDQLPGLSGYLIVPNWFEVIYSAAMQADQGRLYVAGLVAANGTRARVHTTGWETQAVSVYDVRDAERPVQLLTTQAVAAGNTWEVDFWDEWATGTASPRYYLATAATLRAPLAIEVDVPSTLLSTSNEADYIAIAHASLADAVQPLLAHRAAQGLRTRLVDVQDIYDEWSGGQMDPEAIRSFLSYAYHHWNQGGPPPAYVLLVGDGHYDFKNYLGLNFPNLIPPYLAYVDPVMGETAADNRYVCADGPDDVLPDMHLGRLSARTPADVTAYINKIVAYEGAAAGDWQQRAVFVADADDDRAGNFHLMSDNVRLNWLPAVYKDEVVYFKMDEDHNTGAEMRSAIKAEFNRGTAYLQWFGHGSQSRWGSVSMFDTLDVPALDPQNRLPLTVHMACWTGYFIYLPPSNPSTLGSQSLGEVLVLTPGRGSIADISPTGQHTGGPAMLFNQGLIKALYLDSIMQPGPAIDAARYYYFYNSVGALDILDTMILLGDPALRLRMAKNVYLPLMQVP